MTDQRREQRTYPPRSAYMPYIHTTEMARRIERHIQLAQLDEEIRRDEAMMMKRVHDSRMKTENAIRKLRLEQERRLIKEKQRLQEHEARRRARRQNREQLERELERIKNELRAELTKEDVKCQKAEEERQQHKEERKRLASIHEREERLKHTKGRQPALELNLKAQEQKQIIKDKQSTSTGQEKKIIQDETKHEEQRTVAGTENRNGTCMEPNERSHKGREKEVQTNYSGNSHNNANTDSTSSNDTPQQDCTCSIPYDQLNISCEKMTTLEVLQNADCQEMPLDHTLDVCIVQECTSDDIVQSDCAPANLSDEQLQVFETKNINLKVYHVTDLQEKVMQRSLQKYIAQECASEVPQSMIQLGILNVDSEVREIMYAESRDIVLTGKNSCLCFKFLWWQEGTLSS